MPEVLDCRVATFGGGDASSALGSPSSLTLFDVTTQIWPYLDVYEKLAVRQSCREGLRVHDGLVTAISIHDLWGRVLPGSPQEIAAFIRRAVERGCAPGELVLRLRGCSVTAREARGVAVLSAFASAPGGAPRALHGSGAVSRSRDSSSGTSVLSFTSSSTCSSSDHTAAWDSSSRSSGLGSGSSGTSSSGGNSGGGALGSGGSGGGGGRSNTSSLTALRLEGVPLTPRLLGKLAAAGRGLTRLKLYGYDLSDGDGDGGAKTLPQPSRSMDKSRQPGGQTPAPRPRAAPIRGSSEARGAPALLRLLGPQLQELTLQDCSFGVAAATQSSDDGPGGNAGPGTSSGANGGGGVPAGGGDSSRDLAMAAAAPLLAALQGCTVLRHLGLRNADEAGCPVLQLLLQPDAASACGRGGGGSSRGCGGLAAAVRAGGSPSVAVPGGTSGGDTAEHRPSAGRGGGGTAAGPQQQQPQAVLASLARLTSLKIQTPLPGPKPAAGLGALAAALAPLTSLSRLELGERTAVPSIAALLLPPLSPEAAALPPPPPLLRNLRNLSLVSAEVTSAAEVAVLAQLRQLTQVSLAALSLSPLVPKEEAVATAAPQPPGVLQMPPALQELSVAAPMPPATLLALRRPPTLTTLRLTGFTLGMADADEHVGDGGDGGVAADGGNAPLVMRASSQRQLAEAVRLLHGRFAYRDLGIELHIGFHSPAAGRRRYLAAAPRDAAAADLDDRPMGHWVWASRLVPLSLQGLELAGLELTGGDVAALAVQLRTLEDLRLDCRYPLHAVSHLSGLRRLRRLLLNASFWQSSKSQPQSLSQGMGLHPPPPPPPPVISDAAAAAAALTALCGGAPECLYDVALASYGRATARFCAMQAMLWVEEALPARVGCGALRLWVCP